MMAFSGALGRVWLLVAASACLSLLPVRTAVRAHDTLPANSDSAVATSMSTSPPSSPCPLVFRYEPSPAAASGWIGVVRLLAPPKFSALHLSVTLASPEYLPAEPAPGTLTLRGGVPAARALVRAAQQGRRKAIEYEARFSCDVTTAPVLVNLTVNGRVFCSAVQEPTDTRSTITLVADLETGLEWAAASDDDFGVVPEGSKSSDYGLGGHETVGQVDQSPPCAPAASSRPPPPPPVQAAPVQHTQPASGDMYIPRDYLRPNMYVLPSLNPSYPPQQDTGPLEGYEQYASQPAVPPRPPPRTPSSTAPPVRPHAQPTTPPPTRPSPHTEAPPPPPELVQPRTPSAPQPEATPPPTPTWTEKPSLLEPDCGRAWTTAANPLVTRGAAAVRGRWPWLVALFKKLGRRDQLGLNFECGASLVSRKHVVTAAHCVEVRGRRRRPVDASLLVVYLGKHDLLSYTEPGQQTAEVDSVRLHPNYGQSESESSSASAASSSYDNDIALLVLTERVEPTKHIRPVCLWDAALTSVNLDDVVGKIGAVPGWGKDDTGAISNEIHVANMPIVSQETCLRSNVFYHAFTNKNTFCAGFRNGTSVCNGDSGGGMFLKDPDGRWRIRGIVSVSMFSVNDQSCDAYNYAVFTDVAKYLPWLFDQMYSTWDTR